MVFDGHVAGECRIRRTLEGPASRSTVSKPHISLPLQFFEAVSRSAVWREDSILARGADQQ